MRRDDQTAPASPTDARLSALERSLARWRWATLAALAVGLGVGAARLGPERTSSQGFDVVDAKGTVRAKLGLAASGEPALELLDEKGVAQASLALGEFPRPEDERRILKRSEERRAARPEEPLRAVLRLGAGETFRDPRRNKNGILEPAIELGAGQHLRTLRLRGDDGDERVELRVGPYDSDLVGDPDLLIDTTLRMRALEGNLALEVGVDPLTTERPEKRTPFLGDRVREEAAPYLLLNGTNSRPFFFLSNWAGNQPSFDLWDGGGKSIFAMPDPDREARESRQDQGISALETQVEQLKRDIDRLEAELRSK